MKQKLYVYGTLRPGDKPVQWFQGQMYSLGGFPGVKLGGLGLFATEVIEVEDFARFDRYEGYDENRPETSLYIRKPFPPENPDGFIYEFNGRVTDELRKKQVQSGDWLLFTGRKGYDISRFSSTPSARRA